MDENELFDDLANRAGHIVGSNEAEARLLMGDETYEYVKSIQRQDNANNIELSLANIELMKANTRLANAHFAYRSAVAFLVLNSAKLLPLTGLLAAAWTIYFMVVGIR